MDAYLVSYHRCYCRLEGSEVLDGLDDRSSVSTGAKLVCQRCTPDAVPTCFACEQPARFIKTVGQFKAYAMGLKYCAPCQNKVRLGGPAGPRRRAAVQARREALMARYPQLRVIRQTEKMVRLEGGVPDGTGQERWVRVRLKTSARQNSNERYFFEVGVFGDDARASEALSVPASIQRSMSSPRPTLVSDKGRFLRAAFLHLGKLDVLTVLDALLKVAVRYDQAD